MSATEKTLKALLKEVKILIHEYRKRHRISKEDPK